MGSTTRVKYAEELSGAAVDGNVGTGIGRTRARTRARARTHVLLPVQDPRRSSSTATSATEAIRCGRDRGVACRARMMRPRDRDELLKTALRQGTAPLRTSRVRPGTKEICRQSTEGIRPKLVG